MRLHVRTALLISLRGLFTLTVVVVAFFGSELSRAAAHHAVTESFSKASAANRKLVLYDTLTGVVERKSPDGKYVARIAVVDPGARLFVSTASTKATDSWHNAFILTDDANGCIWLPNYGHALAYSSGGADYGTGILAIWLGPQKRMVLEHAKSDVAEGFDIDGLSQNGHVLVYEHFGFNSPDPNDQRNLRLKCDLSHLETLRPSGSPKPTRRMLP